MDIYMWSMHHVAPSHATAWRGTFTYGARIMLHRVMPQHGDGHLHVEHASCCTESCHSMARDIYIWSTHHVAPSHATAWRGTFTCGARIMLHRVMPQHGEG